MINNQNFFKKLNKRPSISFYNKYLINSIDSSKNNDKIPNNSFCEPENNPLKNIKSFNKPKKELILAKLDTSKLQKRNKNKRGEEKNINKISRNIDYDDSEGFMMARRLSSSFMNEKTSYNSYIYYPKKKIIKKVDKSKEKNEFDKNSNNNIH